MIYKNTAYPIKNNLNQHLNDFKNIQLKLSSLEIKEIFWWRVI